MISFRQLIAELQKPVIDSLSFDYYSPYAISTTQLISVLEKPEIDSSSGYSIYTARMVDNGKIVNERKYYILFKYTEIDKGDVFRVYVVLDREYLENEPISRDAEWEAVAWFRECEN